jgi:hypothetical protein
MDPFSLGVTLPKHTNGPSIIIVRRKETTLDTSQGHTDFSGLKALFLNCTLTRSPDPNAAQLGGSRRAVASVEKLSARASWEATPSG